MQAQEARNIYLLKLRSWNFRKDFIPSFLWILLKSRLTYNTVFEYQYLCILLHHIHYFHRTIFSMDYYNFQENHICNSYWTVPQSSVRHDQQPVVQEHFECDYRYHSVKQKGFLTILQLQFVSFRNITSQVLSESFTKYLAVWRQLDDDICLYIGPK